MTSADFLQFSRIIYLPHLHRRVRAVLDFALFSKLIRSAYALYVVSVRQTKKKKDSLLPK
jgi:hypothetical protein